VWLWFWFSVRTTVVGWTMRAMVLLLKAAAGKTVRRRLEKQLEKPLETTPVLYYPMTNREPFA